MYSLYSDLDSPSGMLKKSAQVAPTMSTLHEDANVEEAEEEEIDVLEASKVPEDKCQLLPSSSTTHRPSATLLDRGHVKDHHQLHPSQTTTTAAMTAASATEQPAMVCIISCSYFFRQDAFVYQGVKTTYHYN